MISTRRLIVGLVLGIGILLVGAFALAYFLVRPLNVKQRIEKASTEHLHLDTTIGDLSITLFPRAGVEGHKLELRVPNHPELPPFVAIEHFTVNSTPVALVVGLLRGHVGVVQVEGMKIVIPPGDTKHQVFHGGHNAAAGDAAKPADSSADADADPAQADAGKSDAKHKIVVDQLISHDAELTILRSKPGDRPLVFEIHELIMSDLGFDRVIPFDTKLTNPVPHGEVVSNGSVGPWKDEPADLPLRGDYKFSNADLDTIKGVGGMLTSTGHYEGTLSTIRVVGESTTPDFNLDLGGSPLPLTAKFITVVDGTNGTTKLESVDARLFQTPIHVTGELNNTPGPQGFDIKLQAAIAHGRIQDVLLLVMKTKTPLFTGDLSLTSSVHLPPGAGPVNKRLQLNGKFELAGTKFSSGDVQKKLGELSRRSQGKDEGADMTHVLSNLDGRFTMGSGRLNLQDLTFEVPGASVNLAGTYTLASGDIDFEGTLRMQATVSQAVGGFKSVFLKPFDSLFKKDGAGAVIPIRISGTRDAPKFGLKMGSGKK